jgi:AcrR family transcriptional regulator
MERNRRTVKVTAPKKRQYDATRRQEQARQTRDAVLRSARRLFVELGFAPTTVSAIAGDAGVSVDTIYKAFGGKAGVLHALCQQALEGAGPVPAEDRSDALQRTTTDRREIIRGFGALTAEVAPRVAPLLLLVREAAALDPELARLRDELDAERLARMTANAANLARLGPLRPDVSVEAAGEIMWAYTAPDLYDLLVLRRGWSAEQFGAFVAAAIESAVLP